MSDYNQGYMLGFLKSRGLLMSDMTPEQIEETYHFHANILPDFSDMRLHCVRCDRTGSFNLRSPDSRRPYTYRCRGCHTILLSLKERYGYADGPEYRGFSR